MFDNVHMFEDEAYALTLLHVVWCQLAQARSAAAWRKPKLDILIPDEPCKYRFLIGFQEYGFLHILHSFENESYVLTILPFLWSQLAQPRSAATQRKSTLGI